MHSEAYKMEKIIAIKYFWIKHVKVAIVFVHDAAKKVSFIYSLPLRPAVTSMY